MPATGSTADAVGSRDAEDARKEARLDLRLVLPALVAWAVLTALVPGPAWVLVAVGSVAALTATVMTRAAGWGPPHVAREPPSPWRVVRGQVALSLAAVGLVCLAGAAHVARDRAGPVAGWGQEGAVVSVTGTVTTEPRVLTRGDEREPLVILDLRLQRATGRGTTVGTAAPVVVMTSAGEGWEELRWRSTVRAEGRLRVTESGDRSVAMLVPRGPPVTLRPPGGVLSATDHVRDRFREAVDPLPADARGLVPGLVIGDTSLTPPDLTEDMRATGMTHLSAVSGSNVALVTGALALLVAAAGVRLRWRTPLVLVGLVGFVLLCRPEPSVLRAAVMGSVGLVALSSARRRVSLPALGAAVLGLLCLDPWLARSYGFALSTLATLGLVVWSRPWGDAIAARLPPRAALVGDALAVPLAAQVACAPVIVLLQGSITTVAVLANLLAAPLVAPTTVLGVVAAVLSPLSLTLATVVAWGAALPAWMLGRIARVGADVPYGTLDWVDGPAGALLLTALTTGVLLTGPWWRDRLRRHRWWGYAALGTVAGLLWPAPGSGAWPPPGWVVAGCDVGQGDAFVVRSGPDSVLVVDTGPDPGPVAACLRDLRVRRVDGLFLSHFHSDHVGGLGGVLAEAEVATAYLSPVRDPPAVAAATLGLLGEAGVPTVELRAGRSLGIGDALVEVVSPGQRPVVGGSAANNASLVLDVAVGPTRMLMTGDIEPEAARTVRRAVEGRDYDLLKVAHHGSAAQDPDLVTGTRAEVALIGVGEDNTFGHPAPSALTLLRGAGMVVLRTDIDGDVAVSRDGDAIVVHRREE
ncbi:ComEC/Rec2 family competence protein [Ornithinimicrobium pekingense]|uniref:Membrane protein n=1 Tax=Ornithinimicrobium pekingense TaxID=384677 RepID=A0ABQ2F709_9MICO|nr:ComEC/Rec2 family competence protein [Ornithinimicrobium pekingense]GGK67551.1 membrane protein [Ornithinimicrobium pekingense]